MSNSSTTITSSKPELLSIHIKEVDEISRREDEGLLVCHAEVVVLLAVITIRIAGGSYQLNRFSYVGGFALIETYSNSKISEVRVQCLL